MKVLFTRTLCWGALIGLYAVKPSLGIIALTIGIAVAVGRRVRSVAA